MSRPVPLRLVQLGLVAARELTDTPAYDRWSAGTLASDAPFNLDAPRDKTPRTSSFVIASLCLLTLLLAQLVFHFPQPVGLQTLAG